MHLTTPTISVLQHNQEPSHALSTVWLKGKGCVAKLEVAMYNIDKSTDDIDYDDPVYIFYLPYNCDMPYDAMVTIQNLSHAVLLKSFNDSEGNTLYRRCLAMVNEYRRARG